MVEYFCRGCALCCLSTHGSGLASESGVALIPTLLGSAAAQCQLTGQGNCFTNTTEARFSLCATCCTVVLIEVFCPVNYNIPAVYHYIFQCSRCCSGFGVFCIILWFLTCLLWQTIVYLLICILLH